MKFEVLSSWIVKVLFVNSIQLEFEASFNESSFIATRALSLTEAPTKANIQIELDYEMEFFFFLSLILIPHDFSSFRHSYWIHLPRWFNERSFFKSSKIDPQLRILCFLMTRNSFSFCIISLKGAE